MTTIVWTFFAVDEDINIGSLHPYYYYNCTVSARTSAGTGPYSTPITVQTEEAGLFTSDFSMSMLHAHTLTKLKYTGPRLVM